MTGRETPSRDSDAVEESRFRPVRESRNDGVYRATFFLILAAMIAPFWVVDYPGMVDYPNHLVRCYILAHYHDNPVWQERYEIDRSPIPNLAIESVTIPLARWMPIVTCGKIFLSLSAILFVTGCSLLGRAITGRPNWLALIAAFLFYNSALLYGFVNYVCGIGVFLCVLAFWLESRDRMSVPRFLVLCGLSIISYLSHLSSIVFLGVVCTTISVAGLYRDRKIVRAFVNLAWLGCPVILMAGFMRARGSVGKIEWATATEKMIALLSPVRSYNTLLDGAVLAVLLICAVVILRKSRIHQAALAGPVMLFLFLITPKVLFTSSAADSRYVIPAFVLLLVSIEPRWERPQKMAVAIALLAMGIRTASIAANWSMIDQRSRQVLQMGSVLPVDARVYVEQHEAEEEIPKRDRGFVHVIQFWTISRQAYLSSLFALPGQQPLVFRQPLRQSHDLVEQFKGYDYVWTNDPLESTRQLLLRVATPAAHWEKVTLWRLRL